uniref:Uncharacterized protein n=1 Tax=Chrysotila carterae TaxID=13221 RepID=A0A7S4EUX0_CHRCT|mmetsp:Transcript_36362/g.76526  ORF Transcript_36362/g.76526 Transcript_36362/m.76526 type:complete len:105 (-) Transcript_36362:518-832(-)
MCFGSILFTKQMAKNAWLTATLLTPVFFACHGVSTAVMLLLQVELQAERHLRREAQQEVMRMRSALDSLQQKHRADQAYLNDMIQRQRQSIEQLTRQLQKDEDG